jgi:hypothetical protein
MTEPGNPRAIDPQPTALFANYSLVAQWSVLAVGSVVLAAVFELIALPAALLLGPMIAGIVMGSNGGKIRPPRLPVLAAQTVVGCLVARAITGDIVLSRLESIDDLIPQLNAPYCWASDSPEAAAQRPDKPSIIIVHDSFYDYIKPFMIGSFKNFKDFYVKQDFIINESLIQKFKPDYFVILYCERYLDSIATFKIQ